MRTSVVSFPPGMWLVTIPVKIVLIEHSDQLVVDINALLQLWSKWCSSGGVIALAAWPRTHGAVLELCLKILLSDCPDQTGKGKRRAWGKRGLLGPRECCWRTANEVLIYYSYFPEAKGYLHKTSTCETHPSLWPELAVMLFLFWPRKEAKDG